jgi:GMP synthase (glutamine-hydrolysing)
LPGKYLVHNADTSAGIILSGSPYSVYDTDSPHADPAIYDLGVPILGICYGLQEMAWNFGGQVAKCSHREYGFANVQISKIGGDSVDALFQGLGDEMQVRIN